MRYSRTPNFDAINARTLTPTQVSATFVPSSHFSELCRPRHSIILGPRGSGKTTLMKMLQPASMASWKHPEADSFIGSVDFTGVFVATDISWSKQLSLLGQGSLDERIGVLLSLACFTTHALKAVISAFQQRVSTPTEEQIRSAGSVILDPGCEASIVSEIARVWYIDSITPSFYSLRQALTRRLMSIREIASRESLLSETDRAERLAKVDYLHLHYLQAAAFAIEVFEDSAHLSPGKWAYAFDELELAPPAIQHELVSSIRSTDERFLFKLALNPFTNDSYLLREATSPAPGQDFDQIPLWYSDRKGARTFCDGLWTELARQRDLPVEWMPRNVLGGSYFQASAEDQASEKGAYAPGSRWAKRFSVLASKDRTFQAYLDARQIDLRKLHLMNHEVRAAEIRKIAPIVALRDFYRREDTTEDAEENLSKGIRSRKTVRLYVGADSIFALSEGNPRIFISLVSKLLDVAKSRNKIPIPPREQADLILETAERFAAMLRTLPLEHEGDESGMGVVQLVRKIARLFHYDAIKGDFKSEPYGSFTVDAQTNQSLEYVVKQALNAGAIVYVPDDDGQIIVTSLRGKRFRLSYLLAPLYGFPIRLGKKVALSKILGTAKLMSKTSSSLELDFDEEADDV